MPYFEVRITRVYYEVFEAETEDDAIDLAFAADDSGETARVHVEEIDAAHIEPNRLTQLQAAATDAAKE